MSDRINYRVGDLVVDVGRGRVTRGAEEVALPKLSFDLLIAMVRAAPNLLSIDDLMSQVWPGIVVSPETVTHRVKALRDALGDDAKSPRYIGGLRGRGYQIVAPVEVIQAEPAAASPMAAPPSAPTTAAPPGVPPAPASWAPPRQHRRYFIAIVALVVLGAALTWWFLAHEKTPMNTRAANESTIAVLPFRDLSEKQDQAYFAEGMADEIRNLLGTIPTIKVIGRTSSGQFKGAGHGGRAAGEALGAGFIVEGSVRHDGDKFRLTAQLTSVTDGTQRWSQTYDRDVSDILRLQQEIATSVVRALQLEVAFVSSQPPTIDREAYDLYLRGLHVSDRFDRPGFEEAIAHFNRALELDPTMVHAAEALAEDLSNMASWSFVEADVGWERTRLAAEAALRIDPSSVRARLVLADRYQEYEWNWPAAHRELMEASGLAPSDPSVLGALAQESGVMGRSDEALRYLREALTVEPLDPWLHFSCTLAYLNVGRFSEAEASARRALEISPTYGSGRFFLAVVLLNEGRPEEAHAEVGKEADPSSQLTGYAMTHFALGRRVEADAALARLEKEYGQDAAMWVAQVYAYRGENDRALEWLERAYQQHDTSLWFIKEVVFFEPLKRDPRFIVILRKMGLPA